MLPPYGWRQREEPTRTLFVGFDVGLALPFVALQVGGVLLGYPTLLASLARWVVLVAGSVLVALLRGFRLEVSARGFTMWWTWCGVPYWRVRLPLTSRVHTVGGFGDPDDRTIIEHELHAEEISLGSSSTCAALCEAIQGVQRRWARSAQPSKSNSVPRYIDRVPGLGRKLCPNCSSRKLATMRSYRWEGPTTRGTCTELCCLACGAGVFRELGTSNMTADEHTAWRNARQLPAARVLRN